MAANNFSAKFLGRGDELFFMNRPTICDARKNRNNRRRGKIAKFPRFGMLLAVFGCRY